MLVKIGICICIIIVLSGCSRTSAGVHINDSGRGGGFIRGDILKF